MSAIGNLIDDSRSEAYDNGFKAGYEQGKRDALLEKENLQVSTVVGYEAGYEQGAKEERERVLDEVYQKLHSDMNDRSFVDSDGDFIQCIGLSTDVLCWLEESIRSSKEK